MSKLDMKHIRFGVTVAVEREQIQSAKFDILAQKKEYQVADLGVLIAKSKKWQMEPQGSLALCRLDLLVFTPIELRQYIDAEIKQKLINMSKRTSEADIKDRLIMLSERV